MNTIYSALNIKNEKEFIKLVESLDLDMHQYIDFMSELNESYSDEYIRERVLEKTMMFGNGSYEKLKEQFSKKPFKRELKENNNVLPSGTYNIIVSNIEVDDYEEGEYNIHGEKELTINHDISNDLDEEIKEAILEDMGESINGSIKVINYDYQIVDKNNKEKIEEDTVYDHSWYEVKKQKYPKRTKEGVKINENYSNESEYSVGQKLMYKKNGTTYVIDKVKGKYYDIKDTYSNKVYPVYKNTLDSEFKLLKEALEDEEVKDDTTEIKEPKQKSSTDPEITKFISTTSSVVDNTTNSDILKGIVDSIDMKLAMVTDIEQSNELSELKQKAETKLVSVKNIKAIDESFHQDGNCDEHDIKIISYVRDNFTPYIKSVGDVNVQEAYIDVLIGDKKSSFDAWMYASLYNGDLDIGWNQDIFHMNDRNDRQRKYIQDEVEDTARECVEEFLMNKNYIHSTDDGYVWNKEWTEDPEQDGSKWLDESTQGHVTDNNKELTVELYIYDIQWDVSSEDEDDEDSWNTDDYPEETKFEYTINLQNMLESINEFNVEDEEDVQEYIVQGLEDNINDDLDDISGGTSVLGYNSRISNIEEIIEEIKSNLDEYTVEPEDGDYEYDDEPIISESYKYNEPIFDIGDNVRFKWGNKVITGKVVKISYVKRNTYYDISSWNEESEKLETYVRVDPISNDMKKIIDGDDYE